MAEPFALRERWFDVSALEFETFLRGFAGLAVSHHCAQLGMWLQKREEPTLTRSMASLL